MDITVAQEQFFPFYIIERELYKTLVINLYREAKESMQVLALWLWLERIGYRNVIINICSSSYYASITDLADEGVTCLNCINSTSTHLTFDEEDYGIPLMRSLIDKNLSLKFFYENKGLVIQGVATMLQEVCVRAFSDIMQQVTTGISSQQVEITSSKDVEGDKSEVIAISSNKLDKVEDVEVESNSLAAPTNMMSHDYIDIDNFYFKKKKFILF
ncbi:uncharacterized protein LOC130719052 [Lotus japonicus]|uniref:uncharacterized protein LOC130719052 n=1 Tax=Lotus japonicus TaxID=34305 RepID=UPI00258C3B94|nr:uncharacterized protein LOC130719052 [Lotus japonicus]